MSELGPVTFLERRMINVLGSTRGLLAQDEAAGIRSMEFVKYLSPRYQGSADAFLELPAEVQMSDLSEAVDKAATLLGWEARDIVRDIHSGSASAEDVARLERIAADNRFYLGLFAQQRMDAALASARKARAETLMDKVRRAAANLRGPSPSNIVREEVGRLLDGAYQAALQNGAAVEDVRLEPPALLGSAVPPPGTMAGNDEGLRTALAGYLGRAVDGAVGALISSRADPVRFCEALLEKGLLEERQALSSFLSDRNENSNFRALLAIEATRVLAGLGGKPAARVLLGLGAREGFDIPIPEGHPLARRYAAVGEYFNAVAAGLNRRAGRLLEMDLAFFNDGKAAAIIAVLSALSIPVSLYFGYRVGAVLYIIVSVCGLLASARLFLMKAAIQKELDEALSGASGAALSEVNIPSAKSA
jgi:hypothetical protein